MMGNKISLKVTADGKEQEASFLFNKKDNIVYAKAYQKEELVGELEIKSEDFNNFCLDLFNEHKRLFSE